MFYFFLILCLSAVMSLPLFHNELITAHDFIGGFQRALSIHQSWRDGDLLARWMPYTLNGYGYPMTNFYPPLFSYLAALLMFIFKPILAFNIAVFMFLFASGLAMYYLGKAIWGRQGGLISAVAYLLAPYHIVDIYVRGAVAESAGFIYPPLLLLVILKLSRKISLSWVLGGIAVLTGLLLTHAIVAMFFLPIAAVFLLGCVYRKADAARLLWIAGVMLLFSILLSLYFWLPVIVENQFVSSYRFTNGYYDFHQHFVKLAELLYAPIGLRIDSVSVMIGVVHLTLALSVIVFWKRISLQVAGAGKKILFFALIAIAAVLLMLPLSVRVWEIIPVFKLVQFPWRFLLCVVFALSVLSGGVLYLLPQRFRGFALWGVLLILIAANLSYTFRFKYDQVQVDDIKMALARIHPNDNMEYLPRWVKQINLTAPNSRLQVWQGQAQVIDQGGSGLDRRFLVRGTQESMLSYYAYYYPGWEVFIDGKRTEIHPDNPFGLMAFAVPAGEHQVRIHFGTTPWRVLAQTVSFIALLLFVVVLIKRRSLIQWLHIKYPGVLDG